jgi:hypothetical protein
LVCPYDISGAYFTGLSPQTTLTVDVRWYIERCPTIDEPSLVVLATPSPVYDPIALKIYSEAVHGLPVGVPVSENPLGEWFNKVLMGVSRYAPLIGAALSPMHPAAGQIGSLLGSGAGKLAELTKKKKASEEKTKMLEAENKQLVKVMAKGASQSKRK